VTTLAFFTPAIRFVHFCLAFIAWLVAANTFIRYRAAVAPVLSPSASVMANTGVMPVHLVNSGRWVALSMCAYALAVITVVATMPLDATIRRQLNVPVAVVRADGAALAEYDAWRALVIMRFVAVLIGWLSDNATVLSPGQVDEWVADVAGVGEGAGAA
jgi:hypothetical protein